MSSYSWYGSYGLDWGGSSFSYGPNNEVPGRQSTWSDPAEFFDWDEYANYSLPNFYSGPVTGGLWPHSTRVYKLYFTGTSKPAVTAGIPVGSRINQASFTYKFTNGTSAYARMRAKISAGAFDPAWINTWSSFSGSNIMGWNRNPGASHSARTSFPGYFDEYGQNDLSREDRYDFFLGSDRVGPQQYMYFWLEHPDPTTYPTADPYVQYGMKGFRLAYLNWDEPSTGSGLLLGNL